MPSALITVYRLICGSLRGRPRGVAPTAHGIVYNR